nr:immunoglobulin heavy chain junction region [Macaca mulatta]
CPKTYYSGSLDYW